jgi:hypothetical protein
MSSPVEVRRSLVPLEPVPASPVAPGSDPPETTVASGEGDALPSGLAPGSTEAVTPGPGVAPGPAGCPAPIDAPGAPVSCDCDGAGDALVRGLAPAFALGDAVEPAVGVGVAAGVGVGVATAPVIVKAASVGDGLEFSTASSPLRVHEATFQAETDMRVGVTVTAKVPGELTTRALA